MLTRDEGTSFLGQGPSAQSALVEVEKFASKWRAGHFEMPEVKQSQ
jgi:biotin/methionine sulfoxide reductase